MKPFEFLEPESLTEAVQLLGREGAGVISGGTDLLAELKEGTAHHQRLVSLTAVEGLDGIEARRGGMALGAGVTLHRLEMAPELEGPWSILREAARGVATPEIRRQGTLGGNLCQRPRCLHYRSRWVQCWKKGDMHCPALESPFQNYLAVMGGMGCHAAHPSDLAPPLLCLDASVTVQGAGGGRTATMTEFFSPPGGDIQKETMLQAGEVLAGVVLPPPPQGWRGTYLKARERSAGDFALVGLALGFALRDGVIRDARVAMAGVALAPVRSAAAEQALEGNPPSEATAQTAARAAFAGARPLPHNGFKIDLGQALFPRAVAAVAEG